MANPSDMKLQLIIEAVNRFQATFGQLKNDLVAVQQQTAAVTAGSGAAGNALATVGDKASASMAMVHGNAHKAFMGMSELEMGIMSVTMRIMTLTMAAGMIAAPFAFAGKKSTDYLGEIETAILGIATSFMTGGKYVDATTGKVLEGEAALNAAQADSVNVVKELQVANLQTIATLDQLIRAYQETLPVAMARGFDRDQVKQFTLAMVQAAGAINLPFEQMGEETRSLLTGSINPRTSRIATVLGLRNEDIAQYQNNAKGLFDFLMDKLQAYSVAGVASQHTWNGLWSNIKDIAGQGGGMAFQGLFESIKYELEQITNGIVTIDEKTKSIKWNPEFVSGVESVRSGIDSITAEIYRLSMLLDKAGGSMTAFGMISLKVAEVSTRFVTIGQFGDSLKNGSEELGKWNKMYEERYNASNRALQALANRPLGLDADGKPLKPTLKNFNYQANTPKVETADNSKEIDDYRKLLQKAHEEYLHYEKAFDDRVLSSLKNATALQVSVLEDFHNQGLLSEQRYLDERFQLEKEGLRKELEQITSRFNNISDARAAAEKAAVASKTTQNGSDVYDPTLLATWTRAETDYQSILKQRETLQANLAQITQKYGIDSDKIARDQIESLEKLNVELLKLQDNQKDAINPQIWLDYHKQMTAAVNGMLTAANPEEEAQYQKMIEYLAAIIQKKTEIAEIEARAREYQRREAEISHELAQLDEKEQLGQISEVAALSQKTALLKESLRLQEASLSAIDKTSNPTAWLAQQAAIDGTRVKLLDHELQMRDLSNDLAGGFVEGIRLYTKSVGGGFKQMKELAGQTAQAMQQSFSDFFFDAMQGKMKSFGDYFRGFIGSIERALAEVMAKQLVVNMIAGGSSLSTMFAHEGGLILHDGGKVMVPRFHFGGLASDEVPAVLLKKERVLSIEQNQLFEKFVNKTESKSGGVLVSIGDIVIEGDGSMDPSKAAELGRMVNAVVTQTIIEQKRPGGLLS